MKLSEAHSKQPHTKIGSSNLWTTVQVDSSLAFHRHQEQLNHEYSFGGQQPMPRIWAWATSGDRLGNLGVPMTFPNREGRKVNRRLCSMCPMRNSLVSQQSWLLHRDTIVNRIRHASHFYRSIVRSSDNAILQVNLVGFGLWSDGKDEREILVSQFRILQKQNNNLFLTNKDTTKTPNHEVYFRNSCRSCRPARCVCS